LVSKAKTPPVGTYKHTPNIASHKFPNLSNELLSFLRSELPNLLEAPKLFDEHFGHQTYHRHYSESLIHRSRQASSPWAVRRFAVLMLHHQLSFLSEDNIAEFEFVFEKLGIKRAQEPFPESVLKDGYTTTDVRGFVSEFKRRLARLDRVTGLIDGSRSSSAALKEFIHVSRQECRLFLGRYLWTPEEVVDRILSQIRVSRGAKDTRPMRHQCAQEEAERTLSELPNFESEILRRLRSMSKIFWVSKSTSSKINALVEYPLTTVVLVLKLPGSDIEIELKRAGDRDENHPLNVYYRRGGDTVPVTHRLHAGSMGEYLRWDAGATAILSRIYRLVHATEPPIPRTVSLSTVYSLPTSSGEQHILRYFTDGSAFGDGFNEMRQAMAESIDAFKRERDWKPPNIDGELGLTAQFLSLVAPGQAILTGTTSFRLDRLARYLSPTGPEYYFNEGLKVDFTGEDAKFFLDDILDEVLGNYIPPVVRYQDPEQYVRAAFSVPENRISANNNYLSMMREIGKLWGTLMALGAFTRGESFVARNVGMRNVWEGGEWKTKIIFMDHDDLDIAGPTVTTFRPRAALPAMADDELHIFGGSSCGEPIKGEVEFLEEIYRINSEIRRLGHCEILQAIDNAYKKTRQELADNKSLRSVFSESFIEGISDWEYVVSGYLGAEKEAGIESWKAAVKTSLGKKGYNQYDIYDFFCAVDSLNDFIHRYKFLFRITKSS
jgi:hypothetical protein